MVSAWDERSRRDIDRELAGERGEFWVNDRKRQMERYVQDYLDGQLILEEDGAGRWRSSGNYIPDECAYLAYLGGIPIDLDATEAKRDRQVEEQIAEYRRNWKPPSEEALAEMRSAFGAGEVIVDVISGRKIQL